MVKITDLNLLLVILLSLFFITVVFAANSANISVLNINDGEEYFSQAPIGVINITVSPSGTQDCVMYVDENIDGVMDWSVGLTNDSATNVSWSNASSVFFNSTGVNNQTQLAFGCNTTLSSIFWTNYTTTANLTYFYINERAPNTIGITDGAITNGSTIKLLPSLTMTLNVTASNCTYYLAVNDTENITSGGTSNVTTRKSYTNASTLVGLNIRDTTFGTFEEAYYSCEDAYGNRSWSNSSSTAGKTWFVYDTTNPTVATPVWSTIYNRTENGSYVNVSFEISDNSTYEYGSCWVRGWQEDGSIINTTGTFNQSTAIATTNCTVEVVPDSITYTGNYTIQAYANDSVNNEGTSTSTKEYNVYILKSGWNLITLYDNLTLGQIDGLFPDHAGVTYVSIWDNSPGFKNFTTYTVDSATNRDVMVNMTMNATYIYVVNDTKLITEWNPTDTSWTDNKSVVVSTEGWNIIPTVKRKTLNQTLYMCREINETCGPAYYNFTWVSYYDPSLGRYCTAKRGLSITSCREYTVTNLTIPRGAGLWALSNANVTMNMSSI